MVHLKIFALDFCCSEEKYFLILNRNMNITIWKKKEKNKQKKKTLCVNSSMNLITAVCAQIE